jgi:Ca2+-transporting ATPase
MLAANFDSILTVGILTIIGYPLPILPLQILWINIATDALPALALGQSPAVQGIMKEKPHPKKENIFKKFFGFILIAVLYQTIANIVLYFYGLNIDSSLGIETSILSVPSHARTLVFTQVVLFELFFVFICKEEKSITKKSILSNKHLIGAVSISFILQLIMIYTPFMQTVFKTVPLTPAEWLVIVLFAATAFLVPRTTKIVRKIFKS